MANSTAPTAAEIDYDEMMAISCLYFALYAVGIPLFLIRHKHVPIRDRGWLLAVLQMTYCLFDILVRFPALTAPCMLLTINSMSTIPVWLYNYFPRYAVCVNVHF